MKNVMRTGFVRVASSKGDRIYGSLDELPEPLRDRARRTLGGPDATVIMIADPEAYEWIESMEQAAASQMHPVDASAPRRSSAAKTKPTIRNAEADREWKVLLIAGGAVILTLWALWLWAIRTSMS